MTNSPKTVGNSTLQVGRIGLGCMGMSEFYGGTRDEAGHIKVLHAAIELGIDQHTHAQLRDQTRRDLGLDPQEARMVHQVNRLRLLAGVKAVAIDMWTAFKNAATKHAPQADVVHDKFHISKHLNEAVDKVRRKEHKALKKEGDDTLAASKNSWLFNPENMKEDRWLVFQSLKN